MKTKIGKRKIVEPLIFKTELFLINSTQLLTLRK